MNSSQEGVSDGQCRMDILHSNFDIWNTSMLLNLQLSFVYVHDYLMSKQVETNVQMFKSLKANVSFRYFYPLLFLRFWDEKK